MANEVVIHVTAKDETGKIFTQVENKARGFGSTLASIGKIAAGNFIANVATTGFSGLVTQFGDSIEQAREAIMVQKQTEAVIASTGGAAGVTAEEVERLANSLSTLTNFDDEAIQSAENLLLTFTSINKDVFPEATELVLDMSQALGQDLKSSAIQLGKAMNDPILGATALRRVGVALTEQQMDQIRAFQESGDILSAQKIIMAELATEFGGSARATADPLLQMSHAIENVKESLGKAFMPAINEAATALAKWVNENQADIDAFMQKLGTDIPNAIRAIVQVIQENEPLLRALGEVIVEVATVVGFHMQIMAGIINAALSAIQGDWGRAWGYMKGVFDLVAASLGITWGGVWQGIQNVAFGAINMIITYINNLISGLDNVRGWLDKIPGVDIGEISQIPLIGGSGGAPLGTGGGSTNPRSGNTESFAKGINFVPRDMPAFLHRGERVLTANENRMMNAGGGGANVTINMYGSNATAESVAAAVKRVLRDQLGMDMLTGPRLPVGAFSPRRA